jgi:hypothetical protein
MKKTNTTTKNYAKLNDYFKYNYYQWATPRTELEAKRYALVKAWRKQTQPITKHEEEV